MLLRAQSRNSSARILQNDQAKYSLQGGTLTIHNYRMWLDDLSVFKLPTDNAAMRGFLAQVEGIRNDIQPVSAGRGRGLLAVVERKTEDADVRRPWAISSSNVLDGDYFQSDWPSDVRIVDGRDPMHRRGWTYFRVRGDVGGQSITGTGRIPFVYAVARQHLAWMRLKIGDTLFVADGGPTAVLQDAQGTTLGHYPQGSFFEGLSRPWMGLHTIDSVRRDAAEQRMPFETQLLAGGQQAQVTVRSDNTRLVYLIDLEADLVRRIDLIVGNAQVGSLEFEYLQDASVGSNEFTAPPIRNERVSLRNSAGLLWLVRLANGNLGG
jgi:hypothetical protein